MPAENLLVRIPFCRREANAVKTIADHGAMLMLQRVRSVMDSCNRSVASSFVIDPLIAPHLPFFMKSFGTYQ